MAWTTRFTDASCVDPSSAGAKGANLARMAAAGLPVPPGFCVTTQAYAQFVRQTGLEAQVTETIASAGGTDEEVESAAAALRAAIVAAPIPDLLGDAIVAAYWKLGIQGCSPGGDAGTASYVAVRSSSPAEDSEDASFTGLYETYLDVCGIDMVLDAVRRCWASMWTARAISCRSLRGFDQDAALIAVVIQSMVPAEVSGRMCTANRLTGATDEIVVNASWGLGEALASGLATPDEHILALPGLRVKAARTGHKERRVVRDPAAGSGTVTEDTPQSDRERLALTGDQLHRLGQLGRRVMAHYGGIPQDIEWALAGGELHLLQCRPATGADFAWDEDLEVWGGDADDPDIRWTRPGTVWPDRVSPFAYSYRGEVYQRALAESSKFCGIRQPDQPLYRYQRGHVDHNSGLEQRVVQQTALPAKQVGGALDHIVPDQVEAAEVGKLSAARYAWTCARVAVKGSPVHGVQKYFRTVDDYLKNRVAEADGLRAEQLAELDDDSLIRGIQHIVELMTRNCADRWSESLVIIRDAVGILIGLIARWYDPDPMPTFTALMAVDPERTTTAEEDLWLWRLAMRIGASAELRATFEQAGPDYLRAFTSSPEGRQFRIEYKRFVAAHGHRGYADADIYHPRRADDPTIDHRNLAALLATTCPSDPRDREREVEMRRAETLASLEQRVRKGPLGPLRLKLFRAVLDCCHRFFHHQDDQRHYFDRYTYSMRRSAIELGRRLAARGRIAEVDDIYFLSRTEAFALLRGEPATELTRAKITGRRANFLRTVEREARHPGYLRDGAPVVHDSPDGADSGEGCLVGVGTSPGMVTGIPRRG